MTKDADTLTFMLEGGIEDRAVKAHCTAIGVLDMPLNPGTTILGVALLVQAGAATVTVTSFRQSTPV